MLTENLNNNKLKNFKKHKNLMKIVLRWGVFSFKCY